MLTVASILLMILVCMAYPSVAVIMVIAIISIIGYALYSAYHDGDGNWSHSNQGSSAPLYDPNSSQRQNTQDHSNGSTYSTGSTYSNNSASYSTSSSWHSDPDPDDSDGYDCNDIYLNDATRYYYEDAQKYQAVVKKWKSVVDEHNRLKEKIGVAYTVANNLSTPVSDEMQKVIDLCIKDLPKLDSADIVETTFSDAFHK